VETAKRKEDKTENGSALKKADETLPIVVTKLVLEPAAASGSTMA